MATTPNLLITHLAAAQAKKEITVNEALDALDQATQGHAVVDVSTVASVVVGLDTYLSNFCLRVAGSTGAAVTVTLPPSNRYFALDNGSDGVITAQIAGGSGSVVLDPGQVKTMIAQDLRLVEVTAGTPVAGTGLQVADGGGVVVASTTRMTFAGSGVAVASSGSQVTVTVSTAAPFAALLYVDGAPDAAEVVARLALPYAVAFASAFAGSVARTQTMATASAAFSLTKNGSGIGSLSFAASATSGTFGGAGASFAIGDVLGVVAPVAPDATLANVSISLLGTRS
jgi:hypothetical protein